MSVPPVTNTSLDNARQLISSAGLSVGNITYQYDASVGIGNVISCDPGVGSSVEEGTAINLVISQGAEPGPSSGPSNDSPGPEGGITE